MADPGCTSDGTQLFPQPSCLAAGLRDGKLRHTAVACDSMVPRLCSYVVN